MELSVRACCMTFVGAVVGRPGEGLALCLLVSTVGDGVFSFISFAVNFVMVTGLGFLISLIGAFSLLPNTSVKAFETDALEICPSDCLIPECLGIPGFLVTVGVSLAVAVGIVF